MTSYEKKKGYCCRIVLIYGNYNKKDIAFREELDHLQFPEYKVGHVLSDTTGLAKVDQGFRTAEIIGRESAGREYAT